MLLVAVCLIVLIGLPGRASAVGSPTVTPGSAAGAPPGRDVLVHVDGWQPGSVVTVLLCGNGARRGSQDCDLVAGESVTVRGAAPEYVLLPVTLPPAPCPCVVRASDVPDVVVATAPFDVIGAPTAPTVGPESVALRSP